MRFSLKRHRLYIGNVLVRRFWTWKGVCAVAVPLGRELRGLLPEGAGVITVSERWIGK